MQMEDKLDSFDLEEFKATFEQVPLDKSIGEVHVNVGMCQSLRRLFEDRHILEEQVLKALQRNRAYLDVFMNAVSSDDVKLIPHMEGSTRLALDAFSLYMEGEILSV